MILQDRYYLGYIVYKGEEFQGRHAPLVTPELFERVQEVMGERSGSGTRQRVYDHYLKGRLWCGHCHDEGRKNRLIVQRSVGAGGGEYFYFFCRGKQEHTCSSRYIDTATIEEKVEEEYHRLKLDDTFAAYLRRELAEAHADTERAAKLRRDQLLIELERLDRQEANLLDLAADGEKPTEQTRDRLRKITDQRVRFQTELDEVGAGLSVGADLIEKALKLAEDAYRLYCQMGPEQRRLFNRAVFERIYVYEDGVSDREYREPFSVLIPASEGFGGSLAPSKTGETFDDGGESQNGHASGRQLVDSWSKAFVVEAMGLEPTNLLTASQALYQLSYAPVAGAHVISPRPAPDPPPAGPPGAGPPPPVGAPGARQ